MMPTDESLADDGVVSSIVRDDPYHWSVDRVVEALCNPQSEFLLSKPPGHIPDLTALETALRDTGVDGIVLLTGLETTSLKEDLGLSKLPHRTTILTAIQILRARSDAYRQYSHQIGMLATPSERYLTPLSQYPSFAPYGSYSDLQNPTPVTKEQGISKGLNGPIRSSPIASTVLTTPTLTANPTAQVSSVQTSHTASDGEFVRPPKHDNSDHSRTTSPTKKRRRIAPQAVTDVSTTLRAPVSDHMPQLNDLAVNDIFFALGRNDRFEEPGQFFLEQKPCRASEKFVRSRMMKYYLRQDPISLGVIDGKSCTAIIPYSSKFARKGRPQYINVFMTDNDNVTVRRDPLSDWPDLEEQVKHSARPHSRTRKFQNIIQWENLSASAAKLYDEEDFLRSLVDRYPPSEDVDDKAVSRLEDVDDEVDSEEERELEEEERAAQEAQKQNGFFTEDVSTAIDEATAATIEKWKLKHLPIIERKAYKIWHDSRRLENQNVRLESEKMHIRKLDARLKSQRDAVLKDRSWKNSKEIYTACEAMAPSVEDREEHKWIIGVLQMPKCPVKPPKVSKRAREALPKATDLGVDEVDLEKEFSLSSDDGLDDFVVEDADGLAEPSNQQGSVAEDRDIEDFLEPAAGAGEPEVEMDVTTVEPKNTGHDTRVQEGPSESDIDVVSPRKRRLRLHITALHEGQTPRTPGKQANPSSVIDLTISSSDSSPSTRRRRSPSVKEPVLTRRLKLTRKGSFDQTGKGAGKKNSRESATANNSDTENMTEDMDSPDRLRKLIRKIFKEWQPESKMDLLSFAKGLDENGILKHVLPAIKAIRGNKTIGEGARLSAKGSMRAAILWIAWVNCDPLRDMEKQGRIPLGFLENATEHTSGFGIFYSALLDILGKFETKREVAKRKRSLTTFFDVSSTSGTTEENDSTVASPGKKKRKTPEQDLSAKAARIDAFHRAKEAAQARAALSRKMALEGTNKDPEHQPVTLKEPVIFLHEILGRHVKEHQLVGIQFMWRELIEDKARQGALLAHTMGLGKTFQVISFLITVSITMQDPRPHVRALLPKAWGTKIKVVILCPPGLIDNWSDEIQLWTKGPQKDHLEEFLIHLYVIRSDSKGRAGLPRRLGEISKWHETGGVLLMSYEYFRTLVENKASKNRGAPLDATQHAKLVTELLKGPDIIVADEAHKLKNDDSAISKAAGQFRTKSRIALTGSPLSNHLEEYYSMISWIAPNYLGTPAEFHARYIEPISRGLYADCTQSEHRSALKKLSILGQNIDPKIDRAVITDMKSDLPPKTEFVITVPLTKTQREAYAYFVRGVRSGLADISSARIWEWIKLLGLLCNHPFVFSQRLMEKEGKHAKALKESTNSRYQSHDDFSTVSDNDEASAPSPPVTSQVSHEVIDKLLSMLNRSGTLSDVKNSNKTRILLQIVDLTCRAEDKLLIFSQSIPTLNYLQNEINKFGITCGRLDGSTPMALRQRMVKDFNGEGSVFLISTKAGGLGLNLYGANRVVIFDFDWNPTWEEQAVGRAYRFGQKKPVFVYRFKSGGTFEDVIEMKTIYKTQLASRVVDKKNPIRFASRSVKDYLFEPKDVEKRALDDFVGKDPDVLDEILFENDESIKAIDLTETFHKPSDEELTPEERKEVRRELEGESLRRRDPDEYSKWLMEQQSRIDVTQGGADLKLRQPFLSPNVIARLEESKKTQSSEHSEQTAQIPTSVAPVSSGPTQTSSSISRGSTEESRIQVPISMAANETGERGDGLSSRLTSASHDTSDEMRDLRVSKQSSTDERR